MRAVLRLVSAPGSVVAIVMAVDAPQPAARLPLCVDLDGTLLKTDTLLESLLVVVKRSPAVTLLLPLWLFRGGKAHLKRQIALRASLDSAALPYHEELLEFLRCEHAAGRTLVLVSAADETIVQPIARHLGLFTDVLASDGKVNLKGAQKMAALRARYGSRGYDYAGNAASDVVVWNDARAAIVVNARNGVGRRATTPVTRTFERPKHGLRVVVRALRIQQWAKNLLVFFPLLMSPQAAEPRRLVRAALAFVAFSLTASAVYLVNDLLDLEADRRHATKRRRPLAAGDMSLLTALVLAPVCLAAGVAVAVALSPAFFAMLVIYIALTTAYSFRLKHVALLDVVILALLYTGRVIAGSVATVTWPSPWLLAFSLFFFLSLAFVKRFSELQVLRQNQRESTKVRGYYPSDLEQIASEGAASGYIAVLVAALYINSQAVVAVYSQPIILWMICPVLLYWISRVWLLAHRGEMHDDPVVFALRDHVSYVVAALVGVILLLARFVPPIR